MKASALLVGLLSVQRAGEVVYARRLERQAKARGAREYGQRHYPAIVALHVGWLLALLLEGRRARRWALGPTLLGCLLQLGRYKVMTDLGPYWNTKILIQPGGRRVSRGVYRYLQHPNYLIVMLEFAVLPLIVGARRTAVVGSLLNAALLWGVRIPAEEAALREYSER